MLGSEGRVAIYAAPDSDDSLWAFGSGTIGYDAASGKTLPSTPPLRLPQERWDALIADPRRYGFHATLMAPFRLAEETGLASLSAAMRGVCACTAGLAPFPLEVRAIGEFLALVPVAAPEALASFAASVVIHFNGFRAKLSQAERERRLAAGLTARQVEHLDRFGYPYVLEDFRFHMSLTGKVKDAGLRAELREAFAEGLVRATGGASFGLDALVLFAQPAPAASFVIRERHALLGAAA